MHTDEEKAFYVGRMWSEGLTPNAAQRLWGTPSRASLGAWEKEALAGRLHVIVARRPGAHDPELKQKAVESYRKSGTTYVEAETVSDTTPAACPI